MRKYILMAGVLVIALAFTVGSIFAQETDETQTQGGWLGVAIVEEDDQVVIARVQTGSPANAADLLIGDVIVSFNGEAVESASQLSELVQAAAPGDTVTLELLRNGESISVDVTLGSARWGKGRGGFEIPEDALSAAELLLHADLQEADGGFEVVNVFAGRNPFDLQEGDVVTTINGQAAADLDLEALMTDMASADDPQVTVTVTRDGEEVTLEVDGIFGRHFGPGRGGRDGRGGRGFGGQQPDNPNTDAGDL